jgi:hypothetical protein
MVENIEKVVERGQRLEVLVDRADGLANQVRMHVVVQWLRYHQAVMSELWAGQRPSIGHLDVCGHVSSIGPLSTSQMAQGSRRAGLVFLCMPTRVQLGAASHPCHARHRLPPRAQADIFQKKGRQLRNKMWWQYCKMKLVFIIALLILGLVIFLSVCYSNGRNCTKKDDGNTEQQASTGN